MSNLSNGLQTSIDQHAETADPGLDVDAVIDEAVALARQAVAASADDDPGRIDRIGTLANALALRARQTGDLTTLVEAIKAAEASRAAGRPHSAMFAMNLGNRLVSRHEPTGDPADLAAAADAFRSALDTSGTPVLWRIRAAHLLGQCEARAGHWTRATAASALAIELLPRLVTRALDHSDVRVALTERFALAADAAPCALHTGDALRAVQLLKQGRGILLAQTLDTRTDIGQLRRAAPELAHAHFAYLSACATAASSLELSDEAVHLSGAFHLAGFTHVVGTLWPIDDNAEMMARFYEALPQGPHGGRDFTASARALHSAALRTRDTSPRLFNHWAHLHIGP